jgi:hypothetical protein
MLGDDAKLGPLDQVDVRVGRFTEAGGRLDDVVQDRR